MGCEVGLVDRGDRETMALIQQVWSVRIAEVELIIEINAVRHNVLGKRVGGLEGQTVPESSLPLHEECVVVIDTRADQGIEPPLAFVFRCISMSAPSPALST